MHKRAQPLPASIRHLRNRCGAAMALLCLVACASAASRIPSPFTDVPRGDWAYTALKQMEKAGMHVSPSICFPSEHGRQYDLDHRTLTRYEFAVITQRVLVAVQPGKQPRSGRQRAHQIALQTTANKLAVEFRQELAQLNGH